MKWKMYNGAQYSMLSFAEADKIGMAPDGKIRWANYTEMIQYNIQYHAHSIYYKKLEWKDLVYFPGEYANFLVHKNLDMVVSVNPDRVLIILVLPKTDIRSVVLGEPKPLIPG